MLAIVFSLFEIAGAAERNGACMTKALPLPLRSLYSERRARADDGFDRNKITVDEIKSYCAKLSDFGHQFPLSQLPFFQRKCGQAYLPINDRVYDFELTGWI
jgi:hypothetical protein